MDLNFQQSEGVSVVEARGRIDAVTSRTFSEGLTQLITSGATHVVIDLAHIAYISSASFRSLLLAADPRIEVRCRAAPEHDHGVPGGALGGVPGGQAVGR